MARDRGFALLASAVTAVALFGMAGMAIDLGRMYIARNEAQTYADSAALYAARELDAAPAKMSYVRVTASIPNVALFFLPVTGTGSSTIVKASAVAGMTLQGTSESNPVRNSLFPYSPIANVDTTVPVTPAAGADPFGWVKGGLYDLKWPRSGAVPCSGDNNAAMINRSQGAREWGEIVLTSASPLSAQITDDAGNLHVV